MTVGWPSDGHRASSISALPAPAAQTGAGGSKHSAPRPLAAQRRPILSARRPGRRRRHGRRDPEGAPARHHEVCPKSFFFSITSFLGADLRNS